MNRKWTIFVVEQSDGRQRERRLGRVIATSHPDAMLRAFKKWPKEPQSQLYAQTVTRL